MSFTQTVPTPARSRIYTRSGVQISLPAATRRETTLSPIPETQLPLPPSPIEVMPPPGSPDTSQGNFTETRGSEGGATPEEEAETLLARLGFTPRSRPFRRNLQILRSAIQDYESGEQNETVCGILERDGVYQRVQELLSCDEARSPLFRASTNVRPSTDPPLSAIIDTPTSQYFPRDDQNAVAGPSRSRTFDSSLNREDPVAGSSMQGAFESTHDQFTPYPRSSTAGMYGTTEGHAVDMRPARTIPMSSTRLSRPSLSNWDNTLARNRDNQATAAIPTNPTFSPPRDRTFARDRPPHEGMQPVDPWEATSPRRPDPPRPIPVPPVAARVGQGVHFRDNPPNFNSPRQRPNNRPQPYDRGVFPPDFFNRPHGAGFPNYPPNPPPNQPPHGGPGGPGGPNDPGDPHGPRGPGGPGDPNDPGNPNGPGGPAPIPPPAGNHYHYYYNNPDPPPPRQNGNDHNQLRDALSREAKLDIRKPDPFNGRERTKWRPFVTDCMITFRAKPNTYDTDQTRVTFAASYLTGTAQSHYATMLAHDPNHPALTIWDEFVREFAAMFGIVNVQMYAEQMIRSIVMGDRDRFATHVVRFEEHAFLSDWNYHALMSELYRSLPARIKEAMKLVRRPENYRELRQLAMQIDTRFWEYEMETKQTTRRFPITNTPQQRSSTPTTPLQRAPTNPTPPRVNLPHQAQPPRRPFPNVNANQSNGPRPFGGYPTREELDRRRREGLCLNCGEAGHFGANCPKRRAIIRATFAYNEQAGEILESYE
jgi:hypothetical protein